MYYLFFNNALAQAPQAIPYQAIARSSSGAIIANHSITIRFTIHDSIAPAPLCTAKYLHLLQLFWVHLT